MIDRISIANQLILKSTPPLTLPLYLDCNGSTPVEPEVLSRFQEYLSDPQYWGNCSAQHARRVRTALHEAQEWLTAWASGLDTSAGTPAKNSEELVFFCASATEANNMVIQGLLAYGQQSGRKHIIATELEHASVLQPCEYLVEQYGFELSLVAPEATGRVAVEAILEQLRPDTLLICCMQVNNETGVVQPVAALGEALLQNDHPAYLHVDAVQGAAHVDDSLYPEASLRHPRIDMLSISGHKMYGICGIAALLLKQRRTSSKAQAHRVRASGFPALPPLQPLLRGGGQQGIRQLKGLRSGSIPLALALSLRDALALCESQRTVRRQQNLEFRQQFWQILETLGKLGEVGVTEAALKPQLNGAAECILPHVCNVYLPGIDAESALLNLRSLLSAGRGAACSSRDFGSSRVLAAMGQSPVRQNSSLRFSWWHHSPKFWSEPTLAGWSEEVVKKLQRLRI